jgi:lipid-A-disaccharide synthase-like uncharacterized protein
MINGLPHIMLSSRQVGLIVLGALGGACILQFVFWLFSVIVGVIILALVLGSGVLIGVAVTKRGLLDRANDLDVECEIVTMPQRKKR